MLLILQVAFPMVTLVCGGVRTVGGRADQGFTEHGLWRIGVRHSLGQGSCQIGRVSENNAAAGHTVRGL